MKVVAGKSMNKAVFNRNHDNQERGMNEHGMHRSFYSGT